jgi:protein gp37
MKSQPELIIDNSELIERERRIEGAERNAYLVRGQELREIRERQLYREYDYPTFEMYCAERWELMPNRASQLISTSGFATLVQKFELTVPSRESHIQPLLSRLERDDDRIAVWRDVLATTNGVRIHAKDVDNAISRFLALRNKEYITLDEWHEIDESARGALLTRAGRHGLNAQKNTDIEWADWSWNPVSGCLHGCPYCYARDIAFEIYPAEVGFASALWPGRLTAPQNQRVPDGADDNVARKNIFTCSMADLFGRWVPDSWIERVLAEAAANAQWNFLFLTKFPKRMSEFEIPANAWMGTTVDLQARVANAEKAFEKVDAPIRWLSIEPMLEPLQFSRLDLFDWIVIGGASSSKAIDGSPATPAWNVPVDWLADLHQQARAANCAIYYKDNSGLTGTTRIREYPGKPITDPQVPAVFDYLRAIPKKEQVG